MNSGDTMTRPSHLFVYGTLLSVAEHPMGDLLRQSAQPVGEGYIQACLYIIEEIDAQGLNRFPGAVPSARPHDRVFGALYHAHSPEPMYTEFDAYEACAEGYPEPYEFLLRPVDVHMEKDQQIIRAASYLYTWDVSEATLIPSGRYAERSPDVR